jgi:hypothetical protein
MAEPSTALSRKHVTPVAAMRAVMAPHRVKLERTEAARSKFDGRLRRAFELLDTEMCEIWGPKEASTPENAPLSASDTA